MIERAFIFMAKLVAFFRQSEDDLEFREEMEEHLSMLAEKYRSQGMRADEAERMARRQFGNVTLLTQKRKEARTTMFFSNVMRDLRYGVRQLAKTPIFTSVCVLTLALGVGANTAVFSVMYAVLAKMLPVHDASKVVYVHTSHFPSGAFNSGDMATSFSYAAYRELREHSGLQEVVGYIPMSTSGKAPVRTGTLPEEAAGDMVSGNYFSGLGVGMEAGRGFVEKDEDDHAAVTVISDRFWESHYARNPNVIGKTLMIKSHPFTIVGVAAKGFEGTEGRLPLDFWIPLQSHPDFNAWGTATENDTYLTKPRFWCMRLMARIPAGVSAPQALAKAQGIFQQAAYLGIAQKRAGERIPQLSFFPAKQFDGQDDSFARSLKTLMAMVGLVLVIAMCNVVMLLMARNANRQREFSIRLAIGAGRREIARQLLTESFLLVALGGAAAWIFAIGATRALGSWAQIESNLQPDAVVLWFTLSILLLLALIFGLAPLRAAMSSGPDLALRSSAAVSQTSVKKIRAGNAVIVAQVAMCVALLVGAGLLMGTLRNLLNIDLGQKTDGLLVFGVRAQHATTKEESIAFFQMLQQRLRGMPGVESVSQASNRPGSGWSANNSGFLIDGHKPMSVETDQAVFRQNTVGSDFFRTMGVPILEGRDFSDADTASAPEVVIVNETFAKKYVGDVNAVGHVMENSNGTHPRLIIGVVKDHKYTGIMEPTTPMRWIAFTQDRLENEVDVEMRVKGDPMKMLPTVRKFMQEINPDTPLLEPMAQSEVFRQSISQQIMFARLAGCFGVLAVVLIATGLYGTLSYRVNKRSAEIGVRMALGAQRWQIVWMVLRGSLVLTMIGVAAGIPLAIAASKGLSSSLYGVSPLDITSYLFAIAGVAIVALVASGLPAGRAGSVDPSVALRAE
ncbi:ABC transporter permease [Edaphobacter sp. 12200R-103]|uniref:ABC transporter permease n=1 Tax=Edaphobacter sp. 12200R-103 TaxID=2703788 RepID=UPI00138D4911|nr:ABC transporter permease [Edaphobacter sp. 12200R-103]QHS52809.1 ABC transporter permease [Edaphobacter sp. 12200R-103]